MIITQTPFRMSFFGGGTDMENFFRKNGGAVLSTIVVSSSYLLYCFKLAEDMIPALLLGMYVISSCFDVWSYNLETILAEKLQTVLARGILNTRMRDFYDIRMLLDTYEDKVNKAVLKDAFAATCKKRGTDHLQEQAEEIIKIIEADEQLRVLWRAYQKKYSYAAEIDYASVISGVRKLMDWIR